MTSRQKSIHDRLVFRIEQRRRNEFEIVQDIQAAESVKVYRAFGLRSLFKYAVKILNLSELEALSFISVSKKAREVPALQAALQRKIISVAKANRIIAVLDRQNASEVIQFASTHSWRETEKEIAMRNPKAASPDRIKILSENLAQLIATVSMEDLKSFERIISLEAQRTSASPSHGDALHACFQAYLEKRDPVRRAERARKRNERKASVEEAPVMNRNENSVRTEQILEKPKKLAVYGERIPIAAAERHAVNARDEGRCTHIDENGYRCNADRWTDIHHVIEVSRGGTNHPDNLTTLCGFHHDLVHQLSLPIDGQITWLRSPRTPYRSGRGDHRNRAGDAFGAGV